MFDDRIKILSRHSTPYSFFVFVFLFLIKKNNKNKRTKTKRRGERRNVELRRISIPAFIAYRTASKPYSYWIILPLDLFCFFIIITDMYII